MSLQKKKKKKKAKRQKPMKVILMTGEDTEEEDISDGEDESGMYLEKEDVLLIYNALKNYKPVNDEEMAYEMLFEQFEEILIVDYKAKLPGVKW
jgi:hypothetical protein